MLKKTLKIHGLYYGMAYYILYRMTATSLLHTCILQNYVGLNQARPNLVIGHAYDELRHYRVVRVHSCLQIQQQLGPVHIFCFQVGMAAEAWVHVDS